MECAHNQEGFCALFSPYQRTCNVPEDEEEWCNYFDNVLTSHREAGVEERLAL